jgi:hypothetical protein
MWEMAPQNMDKPKKSPSITKDINDTIVYLLLTHTDQGTFL